MPKLSETDLILNKDGSIYHLNLLPKQISDTIITVGDPTRVFEVSKFFDSIEFEMNKREFITHVGRYNGKRITVVSTGIGTDNIEIVLTELDALANIDFKTREIRPIPKHLKIIRIGTSGALQQDIKVGSHLVSQYAIGLDNLMHFYDLPQDEFEIEIGRDIQEQADLAFRPYVVTANSKLQQQIAFDMIVGNTVTSPGFYAPQGRYVRLTPKNSRFLEVLNYYNHRPSGFWLTNFEMETAAYYAFGRMMRHEVLSVNAIIANRINDEFAANPSKIVEGLIKKVLDRI